MGGGGLGVKVERRNNKWVCCRASLMVVGACLYVVRNFFRVNMVRFFFFFWICDSDVIPYMYSLSRYCWNLAFTYVARLAYVGLDRHACLSGVFFYGECTVEGGGVYFVFCF